MKILRIQLENYKRIYNGLNRYVLNIPFKEGIGHIAGPNGVGKSTILNALSPLPDSKDDIIEGYEGIKRIKIEKDGELYEVRYCYPINGSTRGYITNLNTDTELIENGNITACKEMIFDLFGLDNNYETLSRLSAYSNKVSFAMMRPADRKKYMSSIIGNLEVYANIYKELSKRSSTFKAMIGTISDKISSTGYKTPQDLEVELMLHQANLNEATKKKENLLVEIGKYSVNDQDIQDSTHKKTLKEHISNMQKSIESYRLEAWESTEKLFNRKCLPNYLDTRRDIERLKERQKTASFDLHAHEKDRDKAINDNHKLGERIYELKAKIDKYHTVDSDIAVRKMNINSLEKEIDEAMKKESLFFYKDLDKVASIDIDSVKSVLKDAYMQSGMGELNAREYITEDNQFDIDKMQRVKHNIYTDLCSCGAGTREYGDHVVRLDELDKIILHSGDAINRQMILDSYYSMIKTMIPVNFEDYVLLKDNLSRDRFIYAYSNGTMTKIAEMVDKARVLDDKITKLNTLKSREEENKKIDEIVKSYKEELKSCEKEVEANNEIVRKESEIIKSNESIVKDAERMLPWYEQLENALTHIEQCQIEIKTDEKELEEINKRIVQKDENIEKIKDLKLELEKVQQTIDQNQDMVYRLKKIYDSIIDYINDLNLYKTKNEKVEILKKYSSSTTGIQTVFVDMYMNKILEIANRFLQRFFGGRFMLQPFVVNESEFRIPVMTDGLMIDDISSMSASQVAMVNLCLSFAILYHSSKKYNIIRLDEIDNALDTENRMLYPIIIDEFMHELGSEQCFVVSHNSEGFSKNKEIDGGLNNIYEIDLEQLKEGK